MGMPSVRCKYQIGNDLRRNDSSAHAARRVQTGPARFIRQRWSRVVSGLKSLPRINPNVVWTPVAEGAVLFSTTSELYYGANQVAAFVWEQLQRSHASFDELCLAVAERFPGADVGQVRADVHELIEDFARHGLVLDDVAA